MSVMSLKNKTYNKYLSFISTQRFLNTLITNKLLNVKLENLEYILNSRVLFFAKKIFIVAYGRVY